MEGNAERFLESLTEFKAVILAASSRALPTLCEGGDVSASLLPVANRPLLWYQLELLKTLGLPEVIVVTTESQAGKVDEIVSSLGLDKSLHVLGQNSADGTQSSTSGQSSSATASVGELSTNKQGASGATTFELQSAPAHVSALASQAVGATTTSSASIGGGASGVGNVVTASSSSTLSGGSMSAVASLGFSLSASTTLASLFAQPQSHHGCLPSVVYRSYPETLGTAEILLRLHDDLLLNSSKYSSVIVMTGDSIVEEVHLSRMVDVHRANMSKCTMLLSTSQDYSSSAAPAGNSRPPSSAVKPGAQAVATTIIGSKSKKGSNHVDFVGCDVDQADGRLRLLAFHPNVAVNPDEESGFKIKLSKALLRLFPKIALYNNLLDPHVYILSLEVIGTLKQVPNLSSIRNELIPYLVKHQFRNKGSHAQDRFAKLAQESSDATQCFAYIASSGYCRRPLTLEAYVEMNKEIASGRFSYKPLNSSSQTIAESAEIRVSSVGHQVSVGEKSKVNGACIGNGCVLGNNVVLINSVLMNGVHVHDYCTIKNSILCEGSIVHSKATITSSVIGASVVVPSHTEVKNETKTNF